MTDQQFLADKIYNEFDRLGVSTNQNSYSGLMVDYHDLLLEERPDVVVVKIYDDYCDGLYDAQMTLTHLKTLSPGDVDLDSCSFVNIWQSICNFEL